MITKEQASNNSVIIKHSSEFGLAYRLLDRPKAGLVLSCSFIVLLAIWLKLDQTIPGFDSAWHALFSSAVRRFLTHSREWSLDNFINLLTQHFNYPAAGWFFNGFVKTVAGDGASGDEACLLVQTGLLAFGFYQASMLVWKDRVKANAGLIVLFCIPLMAGISHLPLLDLLHTAAFAGFLASTLLWRQNRTWKSAFMAACLFGIYCNTKQIAVLYSAPLIGFLVLKDLYKKEWTSVAQTAVVAAAGPLALLVWIIPNYSALITYCESRSQLATTALDKLTMMASNLQVSSTQLWQGLSPLFILAAVVLFVTLRRREPFLLSKAFLPLFSGIFGWLLIISFAFYNTPEPRYFSSLAVSFALLLGGLLGSALGTNSYWCRNFASAILTLGLAQMLLLSFLPGPLVKGPIQLGVSPIFSLAGITKDEFLRNHIACDYRKDPWYQDWVLDKIESTERERYVYLAVMPATWEYNQGSLAYIAHSRKSHIIPVSWRSCTADVTDKFTPPSNPGHIDWFLIKTGYQGTKILAKNGKDQYEATIHWIETGGDYILSGLKILPDGSSLKLYRKDYVKQWEKDAKQLRAKQTLADSRNE